MSSAIATNSAARRWNVWPSLLKKRHSQCYQFDTNQRLAGRSTAIVAEASDEIAPAHRLGPSPKLADHVAQLPRLPYAEHFGHHMQLYPGVLMFTKAVIPIAFNGVDILNLPRYGYGGTH